MPSTQPKQESNEFDSPVVTLTDEAGRELPCYIEHSREVEGSVYLLLLPVDSPVDIFSWNHNDDVTDAEDDVADAEEDVTIVEDDAEIDKIFGDAQAVLSELNLTLKRTAYILTAVGELPPVEEDDIITLEVGPEDGEVESDEFQYLASFYHKEKEYEIYSPIEPPLFFARQLDNGKPQMLSPEEQEKMQPLLEELLFDELEEE